MTEDWRGPINGLLYGMIFEPEIIDEVVNGCANAAVNYTVLGDGPDVYYEAIQLALASGVRLDGLGQVPHYDQAQIADFLRAVATQLDALRPWPVPKLRHLNASTWTTLANAIPIARLDDSIVGVQKRVRGVFARAGDSQPDRYVLMLKLGSGETVALLGAPGPKERVTLLTDAADDPAAVIEHFTAATGFPSDRVTRI